MAEFLINIDVPELDQAIAFYTQAFGLRLARHFGDWAELVGGPSPIYLLPKPAGSAPFAGAAEPRRYQRHWAPVHLDLVVDDLAEAMQRVEAAGARREGEVSQHRYGKLALYTDPFGHGFCLLQFEGKGYAELDAR